MIVKTLDKRVIKRDGDIFVKLIRAHEYRNSAVTIFTHVTVGFDSRPDEPFDLIRFLFDLLRMSHQAADGIRKEFVGPGKNIKSHLLAMVIPRDGECRSVDQTLLHSSQSGLAPPSGNELH